MRLPDDLRPPTGTSNAAELIFDNIDSGRTLSPTGRLSKGATIPPLQLKQIVVADRVPAWVSFYLQPSDSPLGAAQVHLSELQLPYDL